MKYFLPTFWILMITAYITLPSCAPKTETQFVAACIPVKNYSSQQEKQMSAALKSLPPGSPLNDMAVDWAQMRSEGRACAAAH